MVIFIYIYLHPPSDVVCYDAFTLSIQTVNRYLVCVCVLFSLQMLNKVSLLNHGFKGCLHLFLSVNGRRLGFSHLLCYKTVKLSESLISVGLYYNTGFYLCWSSLVLSFGSVKYMSVGLSLADITSCGLMPEAGAWCCSDVCWFPGGVGNMTVRGVCRCWVSWVWSQTGALWMCWAWRMMPWLGCLRPAAPWCSSSHWHNRWTHTHRPCLQIKGVVMLVFGHLLLFSNTF